MIYIRILCFGRVSAYLHAENKVLYIGSNEDVMIIYISNNIILLYVFLIGILNWSIHYSLAFYSTNIWAYMILQEFFLYMLTLYYSCNFQLNTFYIKYYNRNLHTSWLITLSIYTKFISVEIVCPNSQTVFL